MDFIHGFTTFQHFAARISTAYEFIVQRSQPFFVLNLLAVVSCNVLVLKKTKPHCSLFT